MSKRFACIFVLLLSLTVRGQPLIQFFPWVLPLLILAPGVDGKVHKLSDYTSSPYSGRHLSPVTIAPSRRCMSAASSSCMRTTAKKGVAVRRHSGNDPKLSG